MTHILLGKPVREKIAQVIKHTLEVVKDVVPNPRLAIIQVGSRKDSSLYIKNKISFGEQVGVSTTLLQLPELITQSELIAEVEKLNNDARIRCIIVQLPLPEHINKAKVLEVISPKKDVDGLGKNRKVIPATARAIMEILDFYNIQVAGKKVAIIGRSALVGKPTAEVLTFRRAHVEICHRQTKNIVEICRAADILISAAGQAGLVTKDFVSPGQVIIDVGINQNEEGKLVGDVAFGDVEPIVAAITPVPGGVGPVTVACLYSNFIDLITI